MQRLLSYLEGYPAILGSAMSKISNFASFAAAVSVVKQNHRIDWRTAWSKSSFKKSFVPVLVSSHFYTVFASITSIVMMISNLTVFRVFVVPQGSGLDTQVLVSKLPKKNIHRLFFSCWLSLLFYFMCRHSLILIKQAALITTKVDRICSCCCVNFLPSVLRR